MVVVVTEMPIVVIFEVMVVVVEVMMTGCGGRAGNGRTGGNGW